MTHQKLLKPTRVLHHGLEEVELVKDEVRAVCLEMVDQVFDLRSIRFSLSLGAYMCVHVADFLFVEAGGETCNNLTSFKPEVWMRARLA